ncbi:hypothetical protein ASE36_06550 [Rhizobium sp. Root274]|uniref:glyoxalase superfamily protein n=1 Tax=unclassified Rhizobium TaxID=2613769 RepID=UPI0007146FAD|nr:MULTISPECIES: glyoxalase superfamily protein [unclassified Rhizobium]KQW31868.1 hypothetical protein ASC71_06560 [Rhizobium sp. Root1240]KRD33407.1 hypothetical protein ASE36_06550 [Rhizobium sp. Root274]
MTVRTIAEAKAHAKALRARLAAEGTIVGHAKALELVAHQNGARDWNTLSAKLARAASPRFYLQQRVRGYYLGQAFEGEIVEIRSSNSGHAVSIRFDQPVDTVTFASFSNLRRVARGVVDDSGRSVEKTSNGVPHLIIAAL